ALNDQALAALRKERVPEAVLAKLNGLKDKEYKTVEDFQKALASQLSREELDLYESKMLVYADKDQRPQSPEQQAVTSAPKDPNPEKKPETLQAMQQSLQTTGFAAKVSKGLIEGGQEKAGKVQKVPVRFYRDPVMSSVIYYYKPGSAKANP